MNKLKKLFNKNRTITYYEIDYNGKYYRDVYGEYIEICEKLRGIPSYYSKRTMLDTSVKGTVLAIIKTIIHPFIFLSKVILTILYLPIVTILFSLFCIYLTCAIVIYKCFKE
jgi:hypothetical protein